MTCYVLITPEIEDHVRDIGKTFVANAIVEQLRSEDKKVLYVDESKFDADIVTKDVSNWNIRHLLLRRNRYDYIVIAGTTETVESAFRVFRKHFFPENVKTIKLQCLS